MPLEARQALPQVGVHALIGGQLRQRAPAARLGQDELRRDRRAIAVRGAEVELDRQERLEVGVEQRVLAPPETRHQDQPAGLLGDQSLEHAALLGTELVRPRANVTKEHHVVRDQLLARREGVDVVWSAPDALEAGMEQEAVDLDTRVTNHRVAQVAVFPARHRLDEQHTQRLLAHLELGAHMVVPLVDLARLHRDHALEN
jgi:hypothetical protein